MPLERVAAVKTELLCLRTAGTVKPYTRTNPFWEERAVQHKGQLSQSTVDNLEQKDNFYQQFSAVSTRSASMRVAVCKTGRAAEPKQTAMHQNRGHISRMWTTVKWPFFFFLSLSPCMLLHHFMKLPPKALSDISPEFELATSRLSLAI